MEIECIPLPKLKQRSVELITSVIKCFCAACLNPQCRWIKCTTCNIRATMTGLKQSDASCVFAYTNWQVFTTRNEQSSEICLCIDQEETIEYVSTLKTVF